MPAPVRLLLLDGQGVVFTDGWEAFLDRAARWTCKDPLDLRRRWKDQLRLPFWTGTLTETEFWRRLVGDERVLLWRQRLERCFRPGPAVPRLRTWAARVPIHLLSNHRSEWLPPRIDRMGLRRFFADILVSDRLGAAKPDPAAFASVLAQVPDPAVVLFVDDHAENVATARHLGMRTVLARGQWLARVDELLGCPLPHLFRTDSTDRRYVPTRAMPVGGAGPCRIPGGGCQGQSVSSEGPPPPRHPPLLR